MTNDDRLVELRRQRDFLRGPEFRTSVQARRDYPFGYRAAAQLQSRLLLERCSYR